MARPVKCLYCGESFDRETVDCIKIKNRYAHIKCEKIHQQIHKMMSYLLKQDYSEMKINQQIKELTKNGKTEEGILKSLIYWYDIKKEDPHKANGGIRIVNYIYGQAQEYWDNKNLNQQRNLHLDINKIKHPEVETYTIKTKPIKKPKRIKLFNLD